MRTTIVLSFSVALLACGGKGTGFGADGGGPDASTDGNGDYDACAFCGLDTGSPESGVMLGCSGDLRNVIDGSGNVIMTCPDSEGCSGGVCVPACQAASTSKGSIGCDYVIPTPSFYVGIAPPCWAVYIANNWPSPVTPTVTWNGTTYNIATFGRIVQAGTPTTSWPPIPTGGIPSKQVAVLFMEQDPSSTNAGPLTCAALSGDSTLMPAVSKIGRYPSRWHGKRFCVARVDGPARHHVRHSSLRRSELLPPERRALVPDERLGNELLRDCSAAG